MKFVLNIKPSPLKRYRFTKTGKTYNSQKKEMEAVSFLIKSQFLTHTCHRDIFTGPLRIDITFFMQIPKSYSKKKKLSLNGKYHTHKIDLDNLIKKLLDELTLSGIINDDAQFAIIIAKKIWDIEGTRSSGRIEFEITDL